MQVDAQLVRQEARDVAIGLVSSIAPQLIWRERNKLESRPLDAHGHRERLDTDLFCVGSSRLARRGRDEVTVLAIVVIVSTEDETGGDVEEQLLGDWVGEGVLVSHSCA